MRLPASVFPAVTGQLTVLGNHATIERSSASGTPAFRILLVRTGANLLLDSLTISNGLATSGSYGYGGGIENAGGTVTVRSSAVIDNRATGQDTLGEHGGYGGGVDNEFGYLSISGSDISGNTAGATDALYWAYGGGISNTGGTVVVERTTIHNNTAETGTAAADGGGISQCNCSSGIQTPVGWVPTATTTVTDSVVSDNAALAGAAGGGIAHGGGIMLGSGTADLVGSTVASNLAQAGTGGTADGGGIVDWDRMTLSDSQVTGNTALVSGGTAYGGGIYDLGIAAVLLDSVVDGNVPDNCDPPGFVHGCSG
jgi:hypothetical protein